MDAFAYGPAALLVVLAFVHADLRRRHARCKAALERVRAEREEARRYRWARATGMRP